MLLSIEQINRDKHLYAVAELPLVTIYDDNWFVRNDYDVLSFGQRQYLVNYFTKQGFVQKRGQLLSGEKVDVHLPKPNRLLAMSGFEQQYLVNQNQDIYCVTPTVFAEALFRLYLGDQDSQLCAVKALIDKCPYNIEWLRDVSVNTDIEQVTIETYHDLMRYQKRVVEKKFKRKKAL